MTGAAPAGVPIPPVLLVGGGRMGAAMLAGWREQGLPAAVVVDPSPAAGALAGADVLVVSGPGAIPSGFAPRAVVLAVKPQNAAEVLPAYARYAASAVFLSIMAGRTVAGMVGLLGPSVRIIRAMPNTPAAVRMGVTVACAAPGVPAGDRDLCDTLLRAIGKLAWVEDEGLLDAVTAVSGGGPAYVFLLVELLERAAVAEGISPGLARLLARETIIGSAALLAESSQDAAELRRAVTSPKGTTEQALAVLMREDGWPGLIDEAIAAATRRSRDLAN